MEGKIDIELAGLCACLEINHTANSCVHWEDYKV